MSFQTSSGCIEASILQLPLSWSRMRLTRLQHIILFEKLANGKRLRGGPKLRFKCHLKISLTQANINPEAWETVALNRPLHRKAIHGGGLQNFRFQSSKWRGSTTLCPPPTLICDSCSRLQEEAERLQSSPPLDWRKRIRKLHNDTDAQKRAGAGCYDWRELWSLE